MNGNTGAWAYNKWLLNMYWGVYPRSFAPRVEQHRHPELLQASQYKLNNV